MKEKNRQDKLIIFILTAGIVLRVAYMVYTDCTVRSHDLGELSEDGYGHASYILTLIKKHSLPSDNIVQHYQQPLYYILSAVLGGLYSLIFTDASNHDLINSARIISCVAGIITLFVALGIFNRLKLEKKGKAIALGIVAFTPAFIMSGGRVAPDALTAMFISLTFYYTILWYKNRSFGNAICLGIFYGLGVMTKISAGMLCPITIGVILWSYFERRDRKSHITYTLQAAIIGAVSIPLGLWYSVRNYIRFGQEIMYVVNPGEKIYTGDMSIFSRLFMINIDNMCKTPYCDAFSDYNAPVYYLKSSLFGEFTHNMPNFIPVIMLLLGVVLSVLVACALVHDIKRITAGEKSIENVLPAITFIYCYIIALWFYFKMPYGCSMDYRYILFLSIPGAALLGKYGEDFSGKVIEKLVRTLIASFCVMSIVMFVMLGINSARTGTQKENRDIEDDGASYYINETMRSHVRNQGTGNGCWTIVPSQIMDMETEYDYFASFSAEHMEDYISRYADVSNGGNEQYAMAYYAGWFGPVTENSNEVKLHVQDMSIYYNLSTDKAKEKIKKYGALGTGIYFTRDMDNEDDMIYNNETCGYYLDEQQDNNHMVLIIGWDDNYSRDNFRKKPERDGAYICLNSWGEEFGDKGLFYVSYESFGITYKCCAYNVSVYGTDNYSEIYQTDMMGWGANTGYNCDSCYFTNVYTMDKDGQLAAAGFYTAGEKSTYKLYVVKNYQSETDLNNRQLLTYGYLEDIGYHTVDFGQDIQVYEGERVAIVVELTTPGNNYPVCVDSADYDKKILSGKNGFGCLSNDGVTWYVADDINLCLKLYLR